MEPVKLRRIKPTERKEIAKILEHKNDSKLAERARIIRLADKGFTVSEIANIMDSDVRTIRKWIKRFNAEGIKGLYDRLRIGRPEIKDKVSSTVLEIIKKSPSEFGEAFFYWTLDTLLKVVNSQLQKPISHSTLCRILHEAGWKCRSVKGNYKSNAPSKEEKKTAV